MRAVVRASDAGKVHRVHAVPSACGKLAYTSRKRAKAAAAVNRREFGENVEAYKCPNGCHAWHIGHPPGLPRRLAS